MQPHLRSARRRIPAGLACAVCLLAALNVAVSADELVAITAENLDDWAVDSPAGEAHWRVEDGQIIGENPDQKGSILWTKRTFEDFEFELEYRTTSDDYDSGVFTRGPSHQVQIGVSRSLKVDLTGCIYAPKDQRGAYPARTDKVAKFHKLGEWNRLRILVEGNRIQTFLNDEPFVDYEAVTLPAEGPLGLQLHGNVFMRMVFRNLRVREL